MTKTTRIAAIDLFCGVGGLSLGLKNAGVKVIAGIDLDAACKFPYETNIGAKFIQQSVEDVTAEQLMKLWPKGALRLLAGCAPCQPFSSHRRGVDTQDEKNWSLLDHFSRLVSETKPDFVTMENVTRLMRMEVFERFVAKLRSMDYAVDYANVYGPDFGLPQERRRLVLMASKLGVVRVPVGSFRASGKTVTVKEAIGGLPLLSHGQVDPSDPLHRARTLSPTNLKRMIASKPGGSWADWPDELLSPCHRKDSGASFKSFYGRMKWDSPSPTITTQSFNFGTGRFGHPQQDRSLTLREAAVLQGFPSDYQFVPNGVQPSMQAVGRLIGNAVPPHFGKAIGTEFRNFAANLT